MKSLPLLLLMACGSDPAVLSQITPAEGPTGTELTISGTGLEAGTKATIGGVALRKGASTPPTTVVGTVPTGMVPGAHPVVLTRADGQTVQGSFTVSAPPHSPCEDPVKIITHIPPTAEVIKIDRHHPKPNERVENIQIKAREVASILHGSVPIDAESQCTSIWIRTKDGREYLFDADKTVDLKDQAYKIGRGMNKPIEAR